MSNITEPGHPTGPEIDDSQNPTAAAPPEAGQHEMLRQLQEMIDSIAREAKPVMRELAAKSAELAALAAERAGPLAARAAEKTQVYGERFAARSKDLAAELRRHEATAEGEPAAESAGANEEAPPQG